MTTLALFARLFKGLMLLLHDQLKPERLQSRLTTRRVRKPKAATTECIALDDLKIEMNKIEFGFVIFLCVGGPLCVIVYCMLGERGRQHVSSMVFGEQVAHEE